MSKSKYSHFKLDDRITIARLLDINTSFRKIAEKIGCAITSISSEIKNRRTLKGSLYFGNTVRKLCERLMKAPFVCNGCSLLTDCRKTKYLYDPYKAHELYLETLSKSRKHIHTSEEGIEYLNELLSDRLKEKKQGINHIYNSAEVGISKSTLYRYVKKGVLDIKNIDLKRQARYKPRDKEKEYVPKKEKINRAGHKYIDYLAYIKKHPEARIAQFDTVVGIREEGYCIFTIILKKSNFMIGFFLEDHTAEKVCEALDELERKFGKGMFMSTFNVCLADRGVEFDYVNRMEAAERRIQRCHVFYCDPQASWQKPELEKNHEFIREYSPKGKSMSGLSQKIVVEMFSHINSIGRDELKGKCPFDLLTTGQLKAVKKLGYHQIKPQEVIEDMPKLLKLINKKKR